MEATATIEDTEVVPASVTINNPGVRKRIGALVHATLPVNQGREGLTKVLIEAEPTEDSVLTYGPDSETRVPQTTFTFTVTDSYMLVRHTITLPGGHLSIDGTVDAKPFCNFIGQSKKAHFVTIGVDGEDTVTVGIPSELGSPSVDFDIGLGLRQGTGGGGFPQVDKVLAEIDWAGESDWSRLSRFPYLDPDKLVRVMKAMGASTSTAKGNSGSYVEMLVSTHKDVETHPVGLRVKGSHPEWETIALLMPVRA
jgi:hypothetical protein